MILAVEKGDKELVKILLEAGADVEAVGTFDRTPLARACDGNAVEIMQILLDKGADINKKRAVDGGTVLMSAAANGRTEAVKLLLKKGADVNIKDGRGFTALTYAKIWKRKDVIDLLRAHGATD